MSIPKKNEQNTLLFVHRAINNNDFNEKILSRKISIQNDISFKLKRTRIDGHYDRKSLNLIDIYRRGIQILCLQNQIMSKSVVC